jgi:hypothetical protein
LDLWPTFTAPWCSGQILFEEGEAFQLLELETQVRILAGLLFRKFPKDSVNLLTEGG